MPRIGEQRLTLEVCEVSLLVEAGLVQTERVDDIDLLLGGILNGLLGLLSGCVAAGVCGGSGCVLCWNEVSGALTEGLASNGDLGAVGLVDDTVNLLEVVRVGDDLVTGEDILRMRSASAAMSTTRWERP